MVVEASTAGVEAVSSMPSRPARFVGAAGDWQLAAALLCRAGGKI